MRQDLNNLKTEIQEFLASRNFVVFYGYPRLPDNIPVAHWDSEAYPDFRQFLETARQSEVKLILFHHREFTGDLIDEVLERLENAEAPRDWARNLQRRLKELRAYEGFVCTLELSFDYNGRLYLFGVRTDWYGDFMDIADEVDAMLEDEADEPEDGPMGEYFSRN